LCAREKKTSEDATAATKWSVWSVCYFLTAKNNQHALRDDFSRNDIPSAVSMGMIEGIKAGLRIGEHHLIAVQRLAQSRDSNRVWGRRRENCY
jgi:hypothetical protein